MGLARVLLLGILFSFGCTSQITNNAHTPGENPSPGSFLECPLNTLNDKELASRLDDSRFILFGEGHTNHCDHGMQGKIISLLAKEGMRVGIGLEMVTSGFQPALDRFNNGEIKASQIKKKLNWEKNWGYDYRFYARIFELAQRYNMPVYGLNLPNSIVRKITRKGIKGLSASEKEHLPARIIDPPREQKSILEGYFAGHSEMLQGKGVNKERFFLAQAVWESKMAEEALQAQNRSGLPMLVFSGSGHVETGLGIGYRLKKICPEAKISRILPKRSAECKKGDNRLYYYCPSRPPAPLGMHMAQNEEGIIVRKVVPDSQAEKKGVQSGAIIVSAQGKKITRLKQLHTAAIEAKGRNEELCLDMLEKKTKREVCFDIGGKEK